MLAFSPAAIVGIDAISAALKSRHPNGRMGWSVAMGVFIDADRHAGNRDIAE
jgi:hypothetical protein